MAVAAHRRARTHLSPAHECPCAPPGTGAPRKIPAGDFDVVVLDNRIPSLGRELEALADPGPVGEQAHPRRRVAGPGRMNPIGEHADHNGGFGGSSIALVPVADADRVAAAVAAAFARAGHRRPDTFVVTPGEGAGRLR